MVRSEQEFLDLQQVRVVLALQVVREVHVDRGIQGRRQFLDVLVFQPLLGLLELQVVLVVRVVPVGMACMVVEWLDHKVRWVAFRELQGFRVLLVVQAFRAFRGLRPVRVVRANSNRRTGGWGRGSPQVHHSRTDGSCGFWGQLGRCSP